jgi:hypothetical protein
LPDGRQGRLPSEGRRQSALENLDERTVLLTVPDGIEPEYGGLLDRVEVAKADVEPLWIAADGAHDNTFCRLPIAGCQACVNAVSGLAEPDEVRIRVEDDQPQRRLQQELLEDRAERVCLSGA